MRPKLSALCSVCLYVDVPLSALDSDRSYDFYIYRHQRLTITRCGSQVVIVERLDMRTKFAFHADDLVSKLTGLEFILALFVETIFSASTVFFSILRIYFTPVIFFMVLYFYPGKIKYFIIDDQVTFLQIHEGEEVGRPA